MSIIFVLGLFFTVFSQTSACPEDTVLRFGQTEGDYIDLPKGVMDNSTTRFSLCTWIKKRFSGSAQPIVLGSYRNIMLGDDGHHNQVAGTNVNLTSKYNLPLRTWFHVCMTWGNEDRIWIMKVYLDGDLIGSNVTRREKLERGNLERSMTLGNFVRKKSISFVFGGDLFRLNIYNRVLTESEVKNMASDMCAREEEKLTSIKVLSWTEILTYEPSGHVEKIGSGCTVTACTLKDIEHDLEEAKSITKQLENEVMGKLEVMELEMNESRAIRHKLKMKQGENTNIN